MRLVDIMQPIQYGINIFHSTFWAGGREGIKEYSLCACENAENYVILHLPCRQASCTKRLVKRKIVLWEN